MATVVGVSQLGPHSFLDGGNHWRRLVEREAELSAVAPIVTMSLGHAPEHKEVPGVAEQHAQGLWLVLDGGSGL